MPSATTWFVHLQGETLGPLTTEKVIAMLTQNRIQFADFAWRSGFTKWVRISDLDEFAAHLPAYPKAGIPEDPRAQGEAVIDPPVEPVGREEPKREPGPKREPKPKVAKTPTRFLRIPISGQVITQTQGKFVILNIAERGVFVAANEPLEIGTELQFRLESSAFSESLQMRGVVIRHGTDQDQAGFAIEFTRLNPVHKSLIEQYVRQKSQEQN